MRLNKEGFTLIELLVVVAVLGILAAGLLITLNPLTQLAKVRDAQKKQVMAHLHQALEEFYLVHGRYPNTVFGDYLSDVSGWDIDSVKYGNKDGILPILVNEGYLKGESSLPANQDQYCVLRTSATCYQIGYWSDNNVGAQNYYLQTRLENKNDPDLSNPRFSCTYCTGTGCYCLRP